MHTHDRLFVTDCILAAGEQDGESERTRWHTILTVGRKKGRPTAGPSDIAFTREDLEGLAARFTKERPFGLHHATTQAAIKGDPRFLIPELSAAYGWIKSLRCQDDELQALVEWTEDGWKLVKSGAFKYPSIEIAAETDQATGKPGAPVVVGATLTNTPFWDVPQLAASDAVIQDAESIPTADAGGADESEFADQPEPDPVPERGDGDHVTNKEESMSDETKAETVLAAEQEAQIAALTERAETAEAEKTALEDALKAKETEAATLSDRVAALEEQVQTAAKAAKKAEEDRRVEALLSTGRIAEGEADDARALFAASADLFARIYEGRKAGHAVPVQRQTADKNDESADTAATDPQVAFNAEVEKALPDCDGNFDAAFAKAVQTHPQLYRAMCAEMEG